MLDPAALEPLLLSYRVTAYLVHVSARGTLILRVGRSRAASDWLLRRAGVRTAALITAHNPESRLQSAGRNRQASRRLAVTIKRQGLRALPTSACSADGGWPVERGLLILGLRAPRALRLAEHFGQNAIVQLCLGSSPVLLPTSILQPTQRVLASVAIGSGRSGATPREHLFLS